MTLPLLRAGVTRLARARLLAVAGLVAAAVVVGPSHGATRLSLALGHDPPEGTTGQPLALSVGIANPSAETAYAVHVATKLPPGLVLEAARPGCGVGSLVTRSDVVLVDCVTDLAPGGSASFTLTVRPAAAGTYSITSHAVGTTCGGAEPPAGCGSLT